LKKIQKILILFLFILTGFSLAFKYFDLKLVGAQEGLVPTTANVTVLGSVGQLKVVFFPINFTDYLSTEGDRPAKTWPKYNNTPTDPSGFIKVSILGGNVPWQLYVNGSDLSDTGNRKIPVNNISFSSNCNGTKLASNDTLSYSLKPVCTGSSNSISKLNSTDVYFYLYVPDGQYNNTYTGNLWLYINASSGANDNNTWIGLNNFTVKVRRYMEWQWTWTPISFGSTAPANPYAYYNATCGTGGRGCGWPANASIGFATNIYTDFYINGTDLASGGDTILANNITYSNATQVDSNFYPTNWNYFHVLNYNRPSSPIPDFANWRNVTNNTNILTWWNISIIGGQPGGIYTGNVVGRLYDVGQNPS